MARLNLSSLRRHLDVLFLINVFVNKITGPSILNTVGLRVPSKITRDQSIFTDPYCAKASLSAKFVSAANAVGGKVYVFNHNYITSTVLNFK